MGYIGQQFLIHRNFRISAQTERSTAHPTPRYWSAN